MPTEKWYMGFQESICHLEMISNHKSKTPQSSSKSFQMWFCQTQMNDKRRRLFYVVLTFACQSFTTIINIKHLRFQ